MRRLFWVAVGATAAVMAVRTVNRLIEERVPPQVRAAAGAGRQAATAARGFVGELRAAMAEREAELTAALFSGPESPAAPRSTGARAAGRHRVPTDADADDDLPYEF